MLKPVISPKRQVWWFMTSGVVGKSTLGITKLKMENCSSFTSKIITHPYETSKNLHQFF